MVANVDLKWLQMIVFVGCITIPLMTNATGTMRAHFVFIHSQFQYVSRRDIVLWLY